MRRKFAAVLMLLTAAITGSWFYLNKNKKPETDNKKEEERARALDEVYVLYTNEKAKYSVVVPKGWIQTEATPSSNILTQTVFEPNAEALPLGTIKSLSFTVIDKPKTGQLLSTQKEYEEWIERKRLPAIGSGIYKIADEYVDGEKAVRIIDMSPDIDLWSVTTWWRKNGVNYYANIMGNGKVTMKEQDSLTWILRKFTSIKSE